MIEIPPQLLNIQRHIKGRLSLNTANLHLTNLLISLPRDIAAAPLNSYISGVVSSKSPYDNITTIKTNLGYMKVQTPFAFELNDKIVFILIHNAETVQLQLHSINENLMPWLKENGIFRSITKQQNINALNSNLDVNDNITINNTIVHGTIISMDQNRLDKMMVDLNQKHNLYNLEIIKQLSSPNNKKLSKIEQNKQIQLFKSNFQNGSNIVLKFISALNNPVLNDVEQIADLNITTDKTGANSLILSGILYKQENTHEVLLKTSIGLIKLDHLFDTIKNNSFVEFELTTINKLPYAVDLTHEYLINQITPKWVVLLEIIDFLQVQNIDLYNNFLNNKIAMPNNEIINRMIAFSKAVIENNTSSWLGNDIVKLIKEHNKDDLINNLSRDINLLEELADQNNKLSWQSFFLPIYDGSKLQQIRLFIKNNKQQEIQKNYKRFIVELDIEKLGSIQVDGFIKPSEANTNKLSALDIIIRSIKELNNNDKVNLKNIFHDALEITGLTGELTFQTVKSFTIKPFNEVNKHQLKYFLS